MAKDPAFLFYSNDFDSKTKFFTNEQVGKYIRLLIAQHQHGHLTIEQMVFLTGTLDEIIKEKFSIDDQGKFFNERLEAEIIKRSRFTKSRINNLMASHKAIHTESRMEIEIEKEIDIDIENKDESNKKRYEIFADICKEREIWKTGICKATGNEVVKIPELLDIFNSHIISGGEFHKSLKEYQNHFRNWLLQKNTLSKKSNPERDIKIISYR